MPRRVSSAQASSAESCWLHDVRTLATRDLSNETSRERFTCVVAYSFVWRDSRTSVTHPLARPSDRLRRGSLRKAFAFLRCIFARLARPFGLSPRFARPSLRSADIPHRTVRAVFPHTALRVGLVSSVSLPFAPRLRFTLIPRVYSVRLHCHTKLPQSC